jgi:hypothetical protein
MFARNLFLALLLASCSSAYALEATEAGFQVRPEGEKILANVGSGAGGPAAELISLMEKAGVPKTVDTGGNPTYTQDPMWAFSVPTGKTTGYSFFASIPLSDPTWSLTNLLIGDYTTQPPAHIQGVELFLDRKTSQTLYGIMRAAGLSESISTGGAVSTYRGEWVVCDKRSFNPSTPFFVCVISNYKY